MCHIRRGRCHAGRGSSGLSRSVPWERRDAGRSTTHRGCRCVARHGSTGSMRLTAGRFDPFREWVLVTFEEFVFARLGALTRYATVVTWDPHLAEDITQEVLLRARAKWSRIGHLDAPEQYVKRMVLNE